MTKTGMTKDEMLENLLIEQLEMIKHYTEKALDLLSDAISELTKAGTSIRSYQDDIQRRFRNGK